jgi:hypothetical protein
MTMEEILKSRCDEARSAGKLARCVPNLGEERLVVIKYGHSNFYLIVLRNSRICLHFLLIALL